MQRRGLDSSEAARRLERSGRNELRAEAPPSALRILLAQFANWMVALLAAAAALSLVVGDALDATAILAVLVVNAMVGFFQEHKAERALVALRSLTAPRARVLRDAKVVSIPAALVVPGDCLALEAGDLVAADARLVEAHELFVNEAPLTGESLPVRKRVEPATGPSTPLAERAGCVFLGTAVTSGTGLAEVSATGMGTEMGRIAGLLATAVVEPTPLQRRLADSGRALVFLSLAVVGLVALLGALRGAGWSDLFLSSISLAVAAVPEGLPALVTIALAIGVERMAARNVLVRRLHAVETLGGVTVVCADKTGTLTRGEMAAREVWGSDRRRILESAAACCDAQLSEGAAPHAGDPMEVAILLAAAELGIGRAEIERTRPRVQVRPFSSETRSMAVARADGSLHVKGALEAVLPLCADGIDGAAGALARMAEAGLRVLAVAEGRGTEERGMRLLGLIGFADPPRPEAVEAVRAARRAGVVTVMITGDHPITANAIAREMGILADTDDPKEVVHARATAEEKLQLVREWKRRGAVVAMTGDGVNDAPAIREAHIGIAMGRSGTEVTRGAADMVLADDNYASLVAAIREGRGIYDNLQKTLVYLLTGNLAELLVMLSAVSLGLPFPLLPLQLLWVNLVTDALPALALVADPPAEGALSRPPRPLEERILGAAQWRRIVLGGLFEAAVVLTVYCEALGAGDPASARSRAFFVLVFSELFRAFAARSATRTFPEVGILSNLRLLGVVVASVALQLALAHAEVSRRLLGLAPHGLGEVLVLLALGLLPVTATELVKLAARLRNRARGRFSGPSRP